MILANETLIYSRYRNCCKRTFSKSIGLTYLSSTTVPLLAASSRRNLRSAGQGDLVEDQNCELRP